MEDEISHIEEEEENGQPSKRNNNVETPVDHWQKHEDDECEFLSKSPLKKQFSYKKNVLENIRRNTDDGEVIRRSIIGKNAEFKVTEANRLVKKLTYLHGQQKRLTNIS